MKRPRPLPDKQLPILEYADIARRESEFDHWRSLITDSSPDGRFVTCKETRMWAAYAALTVREKIAALLPEKINPDDRNFIRHLLPSTSDQFDFHMAYASVDVRDEIAARYLAILKEERGTSIVPNIDWYSANLLADARVLAQEVFDLHAIKTLKQSEVFDDLHSFKMASKFFNADVPPLEAAQMA